MSGFQILRVSIYFLLIFNISLLAQKEEIKLISQYGQQKWTVENGLPHNSISSITQTKDGYMWFGSKIGLIRFNGIDFTLFNKDNHPEVDLTDIWSLAADDSGALWIGSNVGGLIKYKDGKFKSYTTKEGLADNSVWSLFTDSDGSLWIGTGGGGISIFKNGKFKTINSDSGLSSNYIWCITKDHNGHYWIGTDGSFLDQISNGQIRHYNLENGFGGDYVMANLADKNGNIWLGAAGVGLYKYTDGKFKIYTEKNGISNNIIWAVKEDAKQNIWIGTDEGLIKITNGKFDTYNELDGLTNNIVKAIYPDKEGNIWVGTKGGGIVKLRDGPITTFTKREGLPHNNIFSICTDNSNNTWFGTSKGLSLYKNDKFINYYYSEGLRSDNILSLCALKNGELWVGTDGSGLFRLSNGKINNVMHEGTIWSIVEDSKGVIWLGTDGQGIIKYDNKELSYLNRDMGLSGEFISALLEDHNGVIWAGTRDGSGLNRIEKNNIKVLKVEDGLLGNDIFSLFEDKENNLWIGTDAGLNKIKNGKIFSYAKNDGLFSDAVYSINEDDIGKLWISSSVGIYCVSKKQLQKFDMKMITRISCTDYGVSDGMKSAECNLGFPSSSKTKTGKLWFPTVQGAIMINPQKIETNKIIPTVVIDSAIFNGIALKYPDKFQEISPGDNFFEFHFSALSFSVPQKILYKYKLEGYDSSWINGGNKYIVKYTNVKPGNYRFTVIASNNDGIWNNKGASFKFKLDPHYYQTYWFYILCFGLSYSLFIGLVKIRTRKLKEREKFLYLKVEERTADLIEENKFRKKAEEDARSTLAEKEKLLGEKEVLLKEIHHRVKNNLQVISSLLYLNSKQIKDKEALELFKDSQHRVKSIALVHERLYRSHDLSRINFKEYVQQLVKDLFRSYAVDQSFVLLELNINDIFINIDLAVPCGLIINELISNSLKYAFPDYQTLGKKGIIKVSFNKTETRQLLLEVSDNGKGIPKEINEKKKDSLGLQLVETLVSQVEGNLEICNSNGTLFKIIFKDS